MEKKEIKNFIAYLKSRGYVENQKDFGIKIGYKSESAFSQALNRLPDELFEKINKVYPEFSEWRDINMNRDELLKEALYLINKHSVTAYEIEKNTPLTAVGVQKIINGESKRPLENTLNTIISYINNQYSNESEENLKSRLKKFIDSNNISVREFERINGFPNGTINAITDNISKKRLDAIVENFPTLNTPWLLTGKGEMLHSTKPIIREVEEVPEENYMMVEFEDLEVSAGLLGGGEVETLPERKTRLVPREYRKGYYLVVRVSGHSMYDGTARSISEGEELLIRQFEDNYLNLPIRTKLFVIVTNEGVVVKQIKNIDEKNEEITCHSFNPTYEDYIVKFHNVRQIFTVEKKVSSKIIF